MTGCRWGAKNTLVKNYLYLAEKAGVVVRPLTTAVAVRPLPHGGYAVDVERTGAWRAKRTARSLTAGQVVFAAGTWGTQRLLHGMKAAGSLPGISARLGFLLRTNSEALCGAMTPSGAVRVPLPWPQPLVRAGGDRPDHAGPRQLDNGAPEAHPDGRMKLTSEQGHGVPSPTWIPAANDAMRRAAARVDGFPLSSAGPRSAPAIGASPP
jgi:choline dehydrogenase-like flavoprotein